MLPVQLAGNLYLAANDLLEPDPSKPDGRYFAVLLLLGAVSVLAFSSIAVSWHRYILRDEVPQGWQRLRLDGTVWRYIGNVILSFLAMFAVVFAGAIPLGALVFVLGPRDGGGATLLVVAFVIALMCVAMVIFYRLSIKLPAVALERQDFHFNIAGGRYVVLSFLGSAKDARLRAMATAHPSCDVLPVEAAELRALGDALAGAGESPAGFRVGSQQRRLRRRPPGSDSPRRTAPGRHARRRSAWTQRERFRQRRLPTALERPLLVRVPAPVHDDVR